VAIWLSGSATVSINKVILDQTLSTEMGERLQAGKTISSIEVNSAWPVGLGEMSASEN